MMCFLWLPSVQAQETLYRLYKMAQGASKVYSAYNLTDAKIQEYASQTVRSYDSENTVCGTSSKYTLRLKKITAGMKTLNDVKLNFKVYLDGNTANAFAAPDGSIRIYSKLMDIMNDEEVLGIIGHELGHIAGKHSKKQYQAALLASAVRDGLSLSDGDLGQFAESGMADIMEYLLNSKYSRTQESEADKYGYEYLKSIGKNPYVLAKALSKLKALNNDKSGRYTRYIATLFSSHPDIDERVKTLTNMARADGYDTK